MFKENFTQEELNMARQNGFIITGKTGSGKSTLLNVLLDKEVAEVKKSPFTVTKKPQVYYLKLQNGNCISLIDTPGISANFEVYDTQKEKDLNDIGLEDIKKVVSDENIHLKGILLVVNFQEERFDIFDQIAIIKYHLIFPLKKFWDYLIIIFSHVYSDPNGDNLDEIRQSKEESNGIIFSKLMEKFKEISDCVDYKELKIKYYNSYSSIKNEKQKIQNNKNKEDLEILLNDLCQKNPLFCSVEVTNFKNKIIEENGKKYIADYDKISFFDFNKSPLKEKIINISKKEEII